jgi:membrane protein / vitamin K-dependent gamma-carboxylase
MLALYDNYCPKCTRFASWIRRWDWLRWVELKPLRDTSITDPCFDLSLAQKQLASLVGKWRYGYDTLCRIALRLPILWLFLPLFFLGKVTGVGDYLYKQIAIRRTVLHCDARHCKV